MVSHYGFNLHVPVNLPFMFSVTYNLTCFFIDLSVFPLFIDKHF